MRYYLIAGEASGDLHGSNLIKGLKLKDSSPEFRCWGGDLMQAEGAELVKHYKESAVMGFVEVLQNLGKIRRNLRLCKEDILRYRPDVVILIDYPGFNFRIAEFARKKGFTVFYYIAPKVWAWKEGRVHKLRKFADRLFIIFPFETAYFRKWGIHAIYCGNPLLDSVDQDLSAGENKEMFYRRTGLAPSRPIIALLAGSRKMEIRFLLPRMLETAKKNPEYQYVLAGAPAIHPDVYAAILKKHGLSFSPVRPGIPTEETPFGGTTQETSPAERLSDRSSSHCQDRSHGHAPEHSAGTAPEIYFLAGETYSVLRHSQAAVISSGTASLEAALLKIPHVVCYGGNELSYRIARRLVKLKYISLANLILDKPIFKELIQHECTPDNIAAEMKRLVQDTDYRNRMIADFIQVRQMLGERGASAKVAQAMIDELEHLHRSK